jgi:DUF971 family protein
MTTNPAANAQTWPTEIRLNPAKTVLSLTFNNGVTCDLTAEMLRVYSPSAEVQGHTPSERKTVPGKQDVKIMKIEPVGHYAVRIAFDDGHSTGIFSWGYLRELSDNREQLWEAYLDELQAKNMKRSR